MCVYFLYVTNFNHNSCKCTLWIHSYINKYLIHVFEQAVVILVIVPRLLRKQGTLKLIRLSVPLSVRPSVTKTLTWFISSEVLMIEHWYMACMIIVTSPFYWYHALTLTFDPSQGEICCQAGGPQFFEFACYFKFSLKTVFQKSFIGIAKQLLL